MSTNSQGERRERMRGSKQWRAGAFRNTANVGPGLKSSPLPLLGEFFFADAQRTPPGPLPMHDPREAWAHPIDGDFRLTWLGHSTTVLELGGRRVLTDPVFGARASPLSFAGPKRFHAVPASIAQLPPLDAVLLSHDHYDHLCAESVRALAQLDVPVVTALGVGAHLERLGVPERNVHELDWHEAKEVGGVRFTATPAQHFSGRGPGDRNQTLWASWVIEAGRRRVFFSGDTGLTPEFRDLGASFGPFDLVMLEIGAWNQAWGDIHLGPKNALQAFDLLGGGTLFPVHWGTFNLALHAWDEPVETLLASAGSRRIITPKLGLPVVPAHVEGVTPWWREVVAARLPEPLVSEGER
jgi:L-ascorbate metabolism protein UlaG (beta-lactamase superfamily)